MDAPNATVAMLSAAVATLAGTIVVLWRYILRLQRQLLEAKDQIADVYKDRDVQREADARAWRDATAHLEAIRAAVSRRGGR